jgi:membrane-associated protease RseP (regulator of RpoE activity)
LRALLIVLLLLALNGAARGEDQAKGWLGATVKDLSAEDAKTLGMESPRGVKVTARAAGGPAEKAGLEPGDLIIALDRILVENEADFEAGLAAKAPGATIKLLVRRGASEKTLPVELAAEPQPVPILQLDTGGHMAVIKGIAFTPDGRQLVSASEDKTIRVWDLASGKTVRTIRGESAPGPAGKVYAMALSLDGKWLVAGGMFHPSDPKAGSVIRLYDFASGKLVALLKGHSREYIGRREQLVNEICGGEYVWPKYRRFVAFEPPAQAVIPRWKVGLVDLSIAAALVLTGWAFYEFVVR